VGASLVRPVPGRELFLGLIAVGSAVAASNVFNDIADVEADRINSPDRPLAAGDVSAASARMLLVALIVGAMAAGWMISVAHGVWVTTVLTLGLLYSVRVKRFLILGPLVVGSLLASALAFGALLGTGSVRFAVIIGSLEICLFTFGRETLKGIRDVDGDRGTGVTTIANRFGADAAVRVFVGSALAVAVAAAVAAVAEDAWVHLGIMILMVTIPASSIGIWIHRSPQEIRRVIDVSRLLWVTGLVGVALLGV
jgi:4-hydroxybenzoate polyprenyltransferase